MGSAQEFQSYSQIGMSLGAPVRCQTRRLAHSTRIISKSQNVVPFLPHCTLDLNFAVSSILREEKRRESLFLREFVDSCQCAGGLVQYNIVVQPVDEKHPVSKHSSQRSFIIISKLLLPAPEKF